MAAVVGVVVGAAIVFVLIALLSGAAVDWWRALMRAAERAWVHGVRSLPAAPDPEGIITTMRANGLLDPKRDT